MTAWNPVDASTLQQQTRVPQEIRGVTVAVQISPYDLPTAFRGFYVAERGVFRIEFRYPDDEPPRPITRIDDCVSVQVGMYSEKLFAIEVAVDRHNLNMVALVVEKADKAVKHLRETAARPNARLNYGAVDQVLTTSRDRHDLFAITA